MAILKVDTISGIGTEGPVFEGDIEFTSQNFLTLPKGDTTQRGRGRGIIAGGCTPTISAIDFLFKFNRWETPSLLVIQLMQREEELKQQDPHQQEV